MKHTITAAGLFDGTRFHNKPVSIDVEGERIAAVRFDANSASACPQTRFDQHFVMPGMINAHTHIARGGMFEAEEPVMLRQMAQNLAGTLDSGVTTVGDMGCTAGLITSLREHTSASVAGGPDILASGPLLTAPKGYPLNWLSPMHRSLGVAVPCSNERETARTVQRLRERGVDHIKLAFMDTSFQEQPMPTLESAVARAAADEAHRLGMRVYAHAHSLGDYHRALDAGVDALMHSCFEPLDQETVRRIADTGMAMTPTLFAYESVCVGAEQHWDQDGHYTQGITGPLLRSWTRFAEAYRESGNVVPDMYPPAGVRRARADELMRVAAANLVLLRDVGVPVAFGSDAAYGFCRMDRPLDELSAMGRAGLSHQEVLVAATRAAADLLRLADRGRIAPGCRADLVVVPSSVRTDLDALQHIVAVFRRGQRVLPLGGARASTPALRHVLRRARAMAAASRGIARTVGSACLDVLASA